MQKNQKTDTERYEAAGEQGYGDPASQAATSTAGPASAPGETSQAPRVELPTIAKAKQNCCARLTRVLTTPLMNERLMKMAGGDASRVAKNLTAFLSVITQHDGGSRDNKKYYHQCSLQSLTTCFLESMNMQLPFDSRQLVSIVIYDWEAELDISYKGFVNALNKHYRDAYVDAKMVFTDDLFECEESGGKVVFRHVAKDAFRTVDKNFTNVAGAYCYFSYALESGETISRIVRMSRDDIIKVKSKAKTQNVWNDFPSEMGIKAVIRRGAKMPFAAIDLDIDIEEVANRHYALDKPGTDDKLKLLMQSQEEAKNGPDTQTSEPNKTGQQKKDAAPGGDPGNAAVDSQGQRAAGKEAHGQAPVPAPPAAAPVGAPMPADTGNVGMAGHGDANAPADWPEEALHQAITDADFEEMK